MVHSESDAVRRHAQFTRRISNNRQKGTENHFIMCAAPGNVLGLVVFYTQKSLINLFNTSKRIYQPNRQQYCSSGRHQLRLYTHTPHYQRSKSPSNSQ